MAQCIACGKSLSGDEIGLHKKLVNRGATEFMCIECLSVRFSCPVPRLREKIEEFRAMGCMLFAAKPEEPKP